MFQEALTYNGLNRLLTSLEQYRTNRYEISIQENHYYRTICLLRNRQLYYFDQGSAHLWAEVLIVINLTHLHQ